MNKPMAKIIDAGCGNRTFWKIKDSPYILYFDVEESLSYPPDLILDSTKTGFEDGSKHTAFIDPPQEYGRTKNTSMYTTPNREVCNQKWPDWARSGHPRYYGADKFKTEKDLKEYLYYLQKEMYRVLTVDGMLWLKWSENKITLTDVLKIFSWWSEYIRIPIKPKGEHSTPSYWVMLMKKEGFRQGSL